MSSGRSGPGRSTRAPLPPGREVADALRAEFERVFTLKSSLRGEAEAGVSPTGRRTTAQDEAKLAPWWPASRGPAGSPSRLRLLSPAQVRRCGPRPWTGASTTAGTPARAPTTSRAAAARPGRRPRLAGARPRSGGVRPRCRCGRTCARSWSWSVGADRHRGGRPGSPTTRAPRPAGPAGLGQLGPCWSTQPGHDHDRPRGGRRHLPGAAHPGPGGGRARGRAARRPLPTLARADALNLAVALHENGILGGSESTLIGATVDAVRRAESRVEFAATLAGRPGSTCPAGVEVSSGRRGPAPPATSGCRWSLRPRSPPRRLGRRHRPDQRGSWGGCWARA